MIILYITLILRMVSIPSASDIQFVLAISIFISLLFVLIGGPILAGLTLVLFKKRSFGFVFRLWVSIILIGLHLYFYSPPLKITISDDFSGDINLIVDTDDNQNLNINKHGIGYIKKSILSKSRSDKKPNVYFQSGKKVSPDRIIGYDSVFFYGRNFIHGKQSLTFKIIP